MNSAGRFRLQLFGSPSLATEAGVPLGGRATQRHRLALLALLALAAGRGVGRDKLLGYLWPESDLEHARQLLNQAVYHLRKALGEQALVSSRDDLRLDPESVRTDVGEFEAALARGDPERAVGLYAGPFLDGFFLSEVPEFERWTERERERLAGAYARALEGLAEAAEGEREFGRAVDWWKARAAHDPYDSRVALRLMRALDACGNCAGALQHAAIHARLLQEEFGVEPAPEIAALAERLRSEPAAAAASTADPGAREAGEGEPEPPVPLSGGPEAPASGGSPPAQPVDSSADVAGLGGARGGWRPAVVALLVVSLAGAVWAALPRHPRPERSVVVLPFVNMSQDEDQEYFSDGVTEEITSRLSSVPELKVISRTSAMRYKGTGKSLRQIAGELNVAHVLEGSVRRSGGRVRITVQLIDAQRDEHRWAETYDYEVRDIFRVQEEIALEVVRALEVELGERERGLLARQGTHDPDAYELYRRGRYFWGTRTRAGHEQAVAYYRRAIERDSSYADAYAGLADAYLTAYQFNLSTAPEAEVYSRIKWAAERALALDDQSASAHASFAIVLWWQKNWPGAERELRRALELDPGQGNARGWYALLLSGMGRLEEALPESRRVVEQEPFVPVVLDANGWLHYLARDYDGAVEQYRKALEIDPSYPLAHHGLGLAYAQQDKPQEALRAFRRAAELNAAFLPDLAYGLALVGQRQEAVETLARAKEKSFEPFFVGRVYVALGEPDSAFAWFERSNWRFPHRANRSDPSLDPLRSDPRFAQLSARVEREMGMR